MSKVLNWGECALFARKYTSAGSKGTEWIKWDTPADGSTTLETTEGDKTEAKVEGGENEAVRYAKNTYSLSFEVRMGRNFKDPLDSTDGIVDGEYEVVLRPMENKDAPALYIPRAAARTTTDYTSADGAKLKTSFDALKNEVKVKASSSETTASKAVGQIVWGALTAGTDGTPATFEAYLDNGETKTDLLAASASTSGGDENL